MKSGKTDLSTWKMKVVTEFIVKDLIELKSKQLKYKRARFVSAVLLLLLSLLILFHIYTHSANVLTLSGFYKGFMPLRLIIGALALGMMWKTCHRRYEEADEKFENLRTEVVDRNDELWSEAEVLEHAEVCKKLKEIYDINIYHK